MIQVAAGGCSRMDGAALHVLTEYLCARLRDW